MCGEMMVLGPMTVLETRLVKKPCAVLRPYWEMIVGFVVKPFPYLQSIQGDLFNNNWTVYFIQVVQHTYMPAYFEHWHFMEIYSYAIVLKLLYPFCANSDL